jgi:hypothetical protein
MRYADEIFLVVKYIRFFGSIQSCGTRYANRILVVGWFCFLFLLQRCVTLYAFYMIIFS